MAMLAIAGAVRDSALNFSPAKIFMGMGIFVFRIHAGWVVGDESYKSATMVVTVVPVLVLGCLS